MGGRCRLACYSAKAAQRGSAGFCGQPRQIAMYAPLAILRKAADLPTHVIGADSKFLAFPSPAPILYSASLDNWK